MTTTKTTERSTLPIAILGVGNLGAAIARGIVRSGLRTADAVILTRRRIAQLADLAEEGYRIQRENSAAVQAADIVILSVQPQHVVGVLREISGVLDPARHILVSTATGITIDAMRRHVGDELPVIRAMPNLGIQTLNSMTCLVADSASEGAMPEVDALFRGWVRPSGSKRATWRPPRPCVPAGLPSS